jgi:hypothetical protein
MASDNQTVTITRALLALSTAIGEMGRAVEALTASENDTAKRHLETSATAANESLKYLEKLVDLIEKKP